MEEKDSPILNYRSATPPLAKRPPAPRSVWAISVNIGLWYAAGAAVVGSLIGAFVQSGRFMYIAYIAMMLLIGGERGMRPLLRERKEAIVRERHVCPSCGKFLISESFRFCPACGKPVPGRS